jgi:RNA polymerase II subunit A small phosphatase-like protein
MAESLVSVNFPSERPARRPKLNLDATAEIASASEEGKPSKTPRFNVLGKIFSRQFTPTVQAKFFEDKENKPKSRWNPFSAGAEEEVEQSKKKSTLQALWRRFIVSEHKVELSLVKSSSTPCDHESGQSDSISQGNLDTNHSSVIPSSSLPLNNENSKKFVIEDFENEPKFLLPANMSGRKMCLVLDLDETLVHSSFKPVSCDFIINIELEGVRHDVYVAKRPGVDEFLLKMSEIFEIVIFTAGIDKYAHPLLDYLDVNRVISAVLSRDHCSKQGQMYVKDLSKLGRNLDHSLIIDNSPHSYFLHPNNAVPILTWFSDPDDTELLDMMPFLENLAKLDDVSTLLDASRPWRSTYKSLLRLLDENEL